MTLDPITVPPELDLRHWVEDFVYRHHRETFPVVKDGHLEGFIDTHDLASFPRQEWGRHAVSEVMHHDIEAITIPPDKALSP
jgi:predicted transcriptional regulator